MDTPELSKEQKQQLDNERYLAEVIRIRHGKDEIPSQSQSRWQNVQRFLESSAGTALITVLLGGLMGSVVSAVFQIYSKQREIELLTYQQRIEKRQETIKTTFDLIGSSFAPADTLIRFRTEFANSPIGLKEDALDEWNKKWAAISEGFEQAQRKWSSEEKKAVLSLSYYYNNSRQVKAAWKDVNQSMTSYFVYVADNCRDASPEMCKSEDLAKKKDLDGAINYLGCTLEQASKDLEHGSTDSERTMADCERT